MIYSSEPVKIPQNPTTTTIEELPCPNPPEYIVHFDSQNWSLNQQDHTVTRKIIIIQMRNKKKIHYPVLIHYIFIKVDMHQHHPQAQKK